jgi:hypothetical protein
MVRRERLTVEHVEAGPGEVTGPERLDQGILLDDRTAGDVHQDRPSLHLGEVAGPQRVAGALGEDEEDAEDVRGRQELVLGDLGHPELGAPLLRQILAPGGHVHAERLRDRDHRAAQAARAKQAEGLAGQRDGEPGLPATGANDPVLKAGPLRDGEDECPRHLRRRRQAAGRLVAGRA